MLSNKLVDILCKVSIILNMLLCILLLRILMCILIQQLFEIIFYEMPSMINQNNQTMYQEEKEKGLSERGDLTLFTYLKHRAP